MYGGRSCLSTRTVHSVTSGTAAYIKVFRLIRIVIYYSLHPTLHKAEIEVYNYDSCNFYFKDLLI
jgi:hypothetical protein